jgi:hypothetical protein
VISNYAISFALSSMKANGADLSDAIAYTYTQEGHAFYVITFVSGDQTWVFDLSMNDAMLSWHQRGWTDPATGLLHRERANTRAFLNNQVVVGDWQNGNLYAVDPNHYSDDVLGYAGVIQYLRSFPKVQAGSRSGMYPGQYLPSDGKNIRLNRFVVDLECGNGPVDINGLPPEVNLKWSFDHGRTFGQALGQSTGKLGEYFSQPQFPALGMGRFPVFEVSYSFAGKAALNGAWLDDEVTAM